MVDNDDSPLKARFKLPVPFLPIITKVKPSTAPIDSDDDNNGHGTSRQRIAQRTDAVENDVLWSLIVRSCNVLYVVFVSLIIT